MTRKFVHLTLSAFINCQPPLPICHFNWLTLQQPSHLFWSRLDSEILAFKTAHYEISAPSKQNSGKFQIVSMPRPGF